ncbi:hypothetical protein [Dapis sp. BLCC M229]|uniref:hypothetical protein n=1 Tax=Dapis sp. BLCC M229 TaxID=3400188 RepID=UPI003CF43253
MKSEVRSQKLEVRSKIIAVTVFERNKNFLIVNFVGWVDVKETQQNTSMLLGVGLRCRLTQPTVFFLKLSDRHRKSEVRS